MLFRFLWIAIVVYLPPVFTDPDRAGEIEPLFAEIDALIQENADVSGYSYGIVLDGALIHSGSGGVLDLEKKIPATPQSMFRIASMTKSFTAMAILLLRDEGKLHLDDPISPYFPEMRLQQVSADSPPITIRHLLTHSAGFPTDDPWADRRLADTEEEFNALLAKGIVLSQGTDIAFEYSNLGYALLGAIIQKITGVSYEQFIEEKIWKPLEIEAYWDFEKIPSSRLARGYRKEKTQEPLLGDGIFGAMGGMITSIESFSRYAALHLSALPPREGPETLPIKRSTLREMHQPWRFVAYPTLERPVAVAYGYGLFWMQDANKRTYIGHGGGLPGFGSYWLLAPEYGVGIVLFTNLTYAPCFKMCQEALDKIIARLGPRKSLPSEFLLKKREEFLSVLLNWDQASPIFAQNFFLDRSLEKRKMETQELFSQAGKILHVKEIIPKNQLCGSFVLVCEKGNIEVSLQLSPECPPLIQHCSMKFSVDIDAK